MSAGRVADGDDAAQIQMIASGQHAEEVHRPGHVVEGLGIAAAISQAAIFDVPDGEAAPAQLGGHRVHQFEARQVRAPAAAVDQHHHARRRAGAAAATARRTDRRRAIGDPPVGQGRATGENIFIAEQRRPRLGRSRHSNQHPQQGRRGAENDVLAQDEGPTVEQDGAGRRTTGRRKSAGRGTGIDPAPPDKGLLTGAPGWRRCRAWRGGILAMWCSCDASSCDASCRETSSSAWPISGGFGTGCMVTWAATSPPTSAVAATVIAARAINFIVEFP